MSPADAEAIEASLNHALAAQRAAFEARMNGIEGRAELFAAVLGFISIASDPAGCRKRVLELDAAFAKTTAAHDKLAADTKTHAETVAATTASLAKREAMLRKREIAVGIRDRELAAAKAALPRPHDPRGDGHVEGSGLSRELDDSPLAHDAHYPLPLADAPFQPKPVRVFR